MPPEREIDAAEVQRAQGAPPPPPPAPPAAPAAPSPAAPTEAINAAEAPAPPAPPAPAGGTDQAPPAAAAAPAAAPEPKVMDQDWPTKGYDGPQPWEADNTPELTQNRLMISAGSAGPEVAELANFLAGLGYSSSISHGQNPTNAYDDTVIGAVRAFCSEFGVEEDPAVIRARTPGTVGPWIWEALTRAYYKAQQAEAEQG